jgi:hypothetical protein
VGCARAAAWALHYSMSSLLVESPKKPLHCFGSLLPSGVLPLPEGRDASSRWGSAIELVERAPFLDEVRLQTTKADVLDQDGEDVAYTGGRG